MTSVWFTSSNLSYTYWHAGVALQKEHNHGRWDHPSAHIPAELHNYSMWCAQRWNAVGDFVQVALSGHIITACNEMLWDGVPWWQAKPRPGAKPVLRHLTMKRRDRFCPSWVAKLYPTIQTLLCWVKHSESVVSVDGVQKYAKEFLSSLSSYEEFENTRQGDGMHDACATVREIMLLVFKDDIIEALFLLGAVSSVSFTTTCPVADMVTAHQYPRLAWPYSMWFTYRV